MGRWIVIGLLGAVLATILGMWAMLERSQQRLLLQQRGANSTAPTRSSTAPPPMEPHDAAPAGARMVQPESLEQGFIVVVTDRSRIANSSSPIFMPSSHNGWNPGDPKMRLEAQSDMRWRITWEKPTLDSRIAFKFARGAWEKVEVDKDFNNIENRTLPLIDASTIEPGVKPVIELEIANWADQKPGDPVAMAANRYRPITVGAGSLQRMQVSGGGLSSLNRDLLVWLPPGYEKPENASRTYSVLYLNDGQNVFEQLPGVPGEWGADETAARLIQAGKIEPLIIVGIPNLGAMRMQEYMPVPAFDKTPARGEQYVDFIVGEVMPRIERAFRVKTGPEHTGIGGASLGGVISLDAATRYPNKFGLVLAESTPLKIREVDLSKRFLAAKTWPGRVYVGVGSREGDNIGDEAKATLNSERMVKATRDLESALQAKGVSGANVRFVVEEGAVHNEVAWARRLGPALEFLYPAR